MVYIQGVDTVPLLFLGSELASDAQQALGVYLLNEWMMVCFGTNGAPVKICILVGVAYLETWTHFLCLFVFCLLVFKQGLAL